MSTLAIALAKIAVLEAEVEALKAGGAPSPGGGGGSSSSGGGETLPDHMLDNAWADAKIDKDPKQWKGPTQVNRTYSRAPKEWLEMAANNLDFKASKERAAVPVALQERGKNAGKPWHEATTFKAKLLRTWAKRSANKPAAAPKPTTPEDDFGAPTEMPQDDFGGGGADDDIPFGINQTLFGRWDRP